MANKNSITIEAVLRDAGLSHDDATVLVDSKDALIFAGIECLSSSNPGISNHNCGTFRASIKTAEGVELFYSGYVFNNEIDAANFGVNLRNMLRNLLT